MRAARATARNFLSASWRQSSTAREKFGQRKLLHDDDVLTYNRTVPKIERGARTKTATTKLTLIGGDKHGSQEEKESR
jgi:hypothetical protein